jgi:LmbE family N-acetylglucosaminyl deacetylase
MNTLIIAAHPDDEVLGCGGTIARLAQEGHNVTIVIVGEGITSRKDLTENEKSSLLQKLHKQTRSVGEFLGAKDVRLLEYPDNRLDTVPLLDIIHSLEEIIEEVQPEIVYTQHGGDLNIDHNKVFRAVLTATRPIEGCPVKTVLAYEVGSSTEWAFQKFAPVFRPTSFVDISTTLEKKVTAMEMYESEKRAFPHPRSTKAIEAKACTYGSTAGLHAAEAFECIRCIR